MTEIKTCFTDILSMLNECGQLLSENKFKKERLKGFLDESVRFFKESIESIELLWKNKKHVQALILCRSLFEVAIKRFWCSIDLQEERWRSQLKASAAEIIKTRKKELQDPKAVQGAGANIVRLSKEANLQVSKKMPRKFEDVIKEVEAQDSWSYKSKLTGDRSLSFLYSVYRFTSEFTHGHPDRITNHDDMEAQVTGMARVSTAYFYRAIYRFCGRTDDQSIVEITKLVKTWGK